MARRVVLCCTPVIIHAKWIYRTNASTWKVVRACSTERYYLITTKKCLGMLQLVKLCRLLKKIIIKLDTTFVKCIYMCFHARHTPVKITVRDVFEGWIDSYA